MTEQLESLPDDEIQDTCNDLTEAVEAAFDLLHERLEAARASAVAPLEGERESLAREYAALEEAKRNLEALLPAQAREAQRAADALLIKGKRGAAESRLREAQAAQAAPAQMEERLVNLSARIESIRAEKRNIARSVFEKWFAEEAQPVIRAVENGLFITLLEGLTKSCYEFQDRTETGGSVPGEVPYRIPLITPTRFSVLTADEKSPEWKASQKWYGVRR